MTDLSQFSIPQLRDLQLQVAEQIASRQADEKERVRQQILELAASVGMSVEQVMNIKVSKQKRPAAVRYQHPEDSSKQWTGRGRSPKWVKEHLDSGKSIDTLRV
jgi:DNA-binding protein H-NS